MDRELQEQFEKIGQRFEKIDERFEQTDRRFEELMVFLSETVATKDDLKQFATKDDLKQLEYRMEQGFESIRASILSLEERIERLEEKVEKLCATETEDTGALAREVVFLKKRLSYVEDMLRAHGIKLAPTG